MGGVFIVYFISLHRTRILNIWSKGFECNKAAKDGLVCCACGCVMHGKCIGLPDDLTHTLGSIKNLKLFCDECLRMNNGFKSLGKIDELSVDIKKVLDFNLSITNELSDLKKFVSECGDRVEKVVSADESLGESVEKLKNEMNVTWASVVEREIKKILMK